MNMKRDLKPLFLPWGNDKFDNKKTFPSENSRYCFAGLGVVYNNLQLLFVPEWLI